MAISSSNPNPNPYPYPNPNPNPNPNLGDGHLLAAEARGGPREADTHVAIEGVAVVARDERVPRTWLGLGLGFGLR